MMQLLRMRARALASSSGVVIILACAASCSCSESSGAAATGGASGASGSSGASGASGSSVSSGTSGSSGGTSAPVCGKGSKPAASVQAPTYWKHLEGETSWYASPVVTDLDSDGKNELIAGYYTESPHYDAWAPQLRFGIGAFAPSREVKLGITFEVIVEHLAFANVPPDGIAGFAAWAAVTGTVGALTN